MVKRNLKKEKQKPEVENEEVVVTEGEANKSENSQEVENSEDVTTSQEKVIIDLQQQLEKEKENYLRLAAEYDNFRKRSQKEKGNLYKDSIQDVVTEWLPLVDDLERAVTAAKQDLGDKESAILAGVILIQKQAEAVLNRIKVKEIPAMGETFDPNLHNAVMQIEDETKGEQEIVEVFQKGYIYDDRVIRHSVVKVAN